MNLIEHFVSLIAPHRCLICLTEGELLCIDCATVELMLPRPICYRCKSTTVRTYICQSCTAETLVGNALLATNYDGLAKDLVRQMKFERVKAATKTIAYIMHCRLPPLPASSVVCAAPTVSGRIRQRGYDQAVLIAKEFAHLRRLQYKTLLRRVKDTRQVGTNRHDRFSQQTDAFAAINQQYMKNKPILVIDDVLTTGATLESAARLLLSHGADSVNIVAFAHKQ